MKLAVLLLATAAFGAPVTFTTIDRGQQSNIEELKQAVVGTAAEWAALWSEHGVPRPAPAVDFAKTTVIAVFLGTRPTSGFDVEITKIDEEGPDLVVTWRELRPERGAILGQVLTMPYHIVSIPRHAGPIRFKRGQ